MAEQNLQNKEYDFSGKNPNEVLTQDELDHFDEGMKLKNNSRPAGAVDFRRAVQSVSMELDDLFA